mmetsp:Transcript_144732/g.376589  ORF Transcript_144732/g.376589 Transcript_144732/m.376589 type:complete len:266 (+) Transcript_144732:80-877(+)
MVGQRKGAAGRGSRLRTRSPRRSAATRRHGADKGGATKKGKSVSQQQAQPLSFLTQPPGLMHSAIGPSVSSGCPPCCGAAAASSSSVGGLLPGVFFCLELQAPHLPDVEQLHLPDGEAGANEEGHGRAALHHHDFGTQVLGPAHHAPADQRHPAAPEAQEREERVDLRRDRAAQLASEPLPAQVQQHERHAAHHAERQYAEAEVLGLHHEGRAFDLRRDLRVHGLPVCSAARHHPIDRGNRPRHPEAQEDIHRVAPCHVDDGRVR